MVEFAISEAADPEPVTLLKANFIGGISLGVVEIMRTIKRRKFFLLSRKLILFVF